jgi:hypothetical protein
MIALAAPERRDFRTACVAFLRLSCADVVVCAAERIA